MGITLLTLLWTDGDILLPCDFPVSDKPVGEQAKKEHFRAVVAVAHRRGIQPEYVLFDGGCSGLDNRKAVRGSRWRVAYPKEGGPPGGPRRRRQRGRGDGGGPPEGRVVRLKGNGFLNVFRTVAPRRRRGALGHQRTDDDPKRAGAVGQASPGDRGAPPRHQVVLGRIAGPGPQGHRPDRSHPDGPAALRPAGIGPAQRRHEPLVRGEAGHHPTSDPRLRDSSQAPALFHCVSPI